MVFRIEERLPGDEEDGRGVSASDERAGGAKVEKLRGSTQYSVPSTQKKQYPEKTIENHWVLITGYYSPASHSRASSRVLKVTISRCEKLWKFSIKACGMCSVPTHADFFTNGPSSASTSLIF